MTSSLISGHCGVLRFFLGDPGADSGGKGKTKLAEKKGAKKSKERREEPLGTDNVVWTIPNGRRRSGF